MAIDPLGVLIVVGIVGGIGYLWYYTAFKSK